MTRAVSHPPSAVEAPRGAALRVPRRRPRAFQRIVAAIRDDVFARRVAPGDRLPHESALAERFGVSRLAVREALRVLELQGIVEVRHGFQGGAFVAAASTQPVSHALETLLLLEHLDREEIYAARRHLEPAAAAVAARHVDEGALVRLRQCVADAERLLGGRRRAFSKNVEFHELVAAACANRVLRLVTLSLLQLLRAVESRFPSDAATNREACRAHRAVLAALEARDAERAEREMREHLLWLERYFGRKRGSESGA